MPASSIKGTALNEQVRAAVGYFSDKRSCAGNDQSLLGVLENAERISDARRAFHS